jgi:CRP-like cAMP-binding protein
VGQSTSKPWHWGFRASYIYEYGKEILLADIGASDCFGEFLAIDGQPTSAAVAATEDSRIATISRSRFHDRLSDNRPLCMRRSAAPASGDQDPSEHNADRRIVEFSALLVSLRVRAELLRLAKPDGVNHDCGTIQQPPMQ